MTHVILPPESNLYQTSQQMIKSQRFVFFGGIPGVGKSLLSQQLALMSHQAGRSVHLLQWDVVRQPFVTNEYVRENYPEVDGITHGVVRKAVGLWARAAVWLWHQEHSDTADMLIGEGPLIGNRLIELLQYHRDDAEQLLGHTMTRFVIPVPSREVRHTIERKRETSSANPRHEREETDAIPQVLQAAWREVFQVAHKLGITNTTADNQALYDPDIYQGVYSPLLKYRHSQILPITIHLPTEKQSVYELHIQQVELVPTVDEVRAYIAQVELRYPDLALLDREISAWYTM